jgi:hypothetical protein
MEHSALRSPGETVTLFSNTGSDNDECLVWRINQDGTFEKIQYSPSIVEVSTNLFSTDFTLPDDECTIVVLFKKQPIVIVTGGTQSFFVYYRVEEGQPVEYEIILDSGDAVTDGLLDELEEGFYFKDITSYNDSIIIVDNKHFPIRLPYPAVQDCPDSGIIKIENNVWQLVSIPVPGVNVKEYFVDRLSEKYGLADTDMIEICSAYFGDENKFRSYVPGVTNPETTNNFPLVYNDSGSNEITGFWVKVKDLTGLVPDVDDVIFEWSRS